MGTSRFVFDSSLDSSSHGNMFLLGSMGGITFTGGGAAPAVLSTAEIVGDGIGAKRRPFLTSPEELMFEEDCYNDEQLLPEKKRRLTPEQVHMLEMSFEAENKLEPDRKTELAKKLGLQPRQVAVWFQNRRVRWKNKQIQREFDHLKSLYDALLVNHDSVLADNQLLRSEVISLNKKLEAKNDSQQRPQQEHKSHAESTPEEEEDLLLVAQAEAPAPPIVQHDVEEPKGGDHLSNFSLLEVDSTLNEHYMEEVVGMGSFYGGCRYVVHSEEDYGSDDNAGGCYFTGVLSANYKVMQVEEEEKTQHGLSWWVWS